MTGNNLIKDLDNEHKKGVYLNQLPDVEISFDQGGANNVRIRFRCKVRFKVKFRVKN